MLHILVDLNKGQFILNKNICQYNLPPRENVALYCETDHSKEPSIAR